MRVRSLCAFLAVALVVGIAAAEEEAVRQLLGVRCGLLSSWQHGVNAVHVLFAFVTFQTVGASLVLTRRSILAARPSLIIHGLAFLC